jgi:hypothetical protein
MEWSIRSMLLAARFCGQARWVGDYHQFIAAFDVSAERDDVLQHFADGQAVITCIV